MPAKNHLSQKQRERLLKTLKEQENPYIRGEGSYFIIDE
jgi:hypothetical protein